MGYANQLINAASASSKRSTDANNDALRSVVAAKPKVISARDSLLQFLGSEK